jgi:glycosyltransferase involved in cell wall biosynthesis
MRSIVVSIKRFVMRAQRSALVRYVRAEPRDRRRPERRVTILLTSAWGMGGTIRAAHNLGRYLAANGYDVELISAMRTREEPFFGSFPPGVRVRALDDRRPGAVPLPLRPVRAVLRRWSSALYPPSDRRASTWNLWVDLQLVRALRRNTGILMGTRPGLNILAARVRPPAMTVVGLEQMNLGHHIRRLRKAMAKRYGGLDVLVALTEEDRENYAKLLDGRVRLAVIPNTVHDVEGPRADLARRRVLAAGRLEHQKGYDMLIEAFAQVHSAHPDWELRICGHGKLRDQFEQAVREHGLEDVVELPGPSENLPEEMEQASIYALSSRFEGFPLVLLEAMGKGMGVVAFDCPTGPRDIIEDRRNGILVPPKDPAAFAKGLLALIEDEELRRRCGAAAAETAQEYTIEAIGPRWEALFRDLA